MQKSKTCQKSKKKPPPRPPPPNFSKYKSKSTFNLNDDNNLIEWSPPSSPKTERNLNFGGSVSSSFSSSTSSLASSKKSFECDIISVSNNIWPINLNATSRITSNTITNVPFNNQTTNKPSTTNIMPFYQSSSRSAQKNLHANQLSVPSAFGGPTIIRPKPNKVKVVVREQIDDSLAISLPMPSVPPPSPPKNVVDNEDIIPYGVALYDFEAKEPNDLSFQINDIILLIKKVNNDWYFGKSQDREGIFPVNFIEVIVPLTTDNDDDNNNNNTVMALYEFPALMEGDLALKPGQMVKVLRKINNDWLYGESNGQIGQFPSNFVDRIPNI